MKDSEIFLNHYNMIDEFLKRNYDLDSSITFSQKLKKSNNPVVNRFIQELISFGELRNAIVHSPHFDNEVIAEPHRKTVERIIEIFEQITKPKKVFPEFQIHVLGEKEDAYINDILVKMKEKSFSQFPVFDSKGHVCEIINTNTISRWVSSKLEEYGTIIIDQVKVKDLLTEIEHKNNYKFLRRDASIYEAYEMFLSQINNKGHNLDAIFITNSGLSSESLLGLITIEDIANKI